MKQEMPGIVEFAEKYYGAPLFPAQREVYERIEQAYKNGEQLTVIRPRAFGMSAAKKWQRGMIERNKPRTNNGSDAQELKQ